MTHSVQDNQLINHAKSYGHGIWFIIVWKWLCRKQALHGARVTYSWVCMSSRTSVVAPFSTVTRPRACSPEQSHWFDMRLSGVRECFHLKRRCSLEPAPGCHVGFTFRSFVAALYQSCSSSYKYYDWRRSNVIRQVSSIVRTPTGYK